jgi:hypothetical protein
MSGFNKLACLSVLTDVLQERFADHARFAEQVYEDGTDLFYATRALGADKAIAQHREQETLTWLGLLDQAVAHAACETDPWHLRAELLGVASLVVAWLEALEGREAGSGA